MAGAGGVDPLLRDAELTVGDLVLRMRCNPEIPIPPGDQILIKLPARWCTLVPA
jgi:hypothetical protein